MRDGGRLSFVGAGLLIVGAVLAIGTKASGQQPPPKGFAQQPKGTVPPGKTAPLPPGKISPFPPGKGAVPPPKAPPNAPAKGPKLPEPEEVSLKTDDGVNLRATFYPGSAKKESVPIIMIHGFGGQRGDFHGLATYLQSLGHASLVPDLRGHGQSTLQTLPNGSAVTLDADRMRAPALEEMIHDIRECKKWLIEKNDKEELNLNQLCVIGAEFGGIIAVRWAAWDWSRPVLTTGAIGQDVKAIVLLSPTPSFKGVTMREALQFPPLQTQLSYLLVAGAKDSKATAEAKRLQKELQVHRPKISEDDEESQKYRDLFLFQPDVALSGTKLLAGGTGVPQQIARFIDLRLVKRKSEFAWKSRSTK